MAPNTDQQRASDRRKVLPNRTGGKKVAGIPATIIVGGGVASIIWFAADQYIPPGGRLPVYLVALSALFLSVIALFHTPDHLPTYEHARRYLTHRARQHTMLNARNGSTKEQPVNDGYLGRILSSSVVKNIRFLDEQGSERAQDVVQVRRPFHNSPAIETTDGGMIGAIKVRPAAMAVADKNHWERRVERLSNAIDSAVTTKVEFTSKMRAVDYGDRIGTYDRREQQLLNQLAKKHGSIEAAYENARSGNLDEEDLGLFVAADLADERQDVIDMYDVTTLKREYYVIVKVEPSDVVTEKNIQEGGGIENVPLLGRLWRRKRLRDIQQEGDHTKVLVDRLESKLDTLASELRTIEDISTHTLSSTEFSQVFADHYKAANVYANADFRSMVRLSPKPESDDGTAMYGVSHDHLNDLPSERLGGAGSSLESVQPDRVGEQSVMGEVDDNRLDIPEKGAATEDDDDDDDDDAEDTGRLRTFANDFAERVSDVNDDPIADVILNEDHLVDHFRTLLAPSDTIYRGDPNWIAIDNALYSKTLSIREWPAVPKMGILEPILREHEPGVAVNVSTHIDPVDQKQAEIDLADREKSREDATESAEESRLPRLLHSLQSEEEEASEMVEANKDSEYDIFKSNTHIELRSDDPDALGRTIDHINSMMNDEGAEVRQETNHHYEGFQSVAPACDDKLEEPIMMFADGIAREFPWTSRNLHEPNGVEFGLNMHTSEPLYLDLWNRKSGFDFGIFTKKGGGKTTTATEILGRLNTVYRDDVMTIIIDPLQEYANLATVHDGERLVVGGDTGINPFHIEETPEEKLATIGKGAPYKHWMEGCMDFIEMYYNDENLPFGEKKGVWRMAIREAAERYGITADPRTHNPEYRAKRQREYFGEDEGAEIDDGQCRALTSAGGRCTRPAQGDGFCYQHDASNDTVSAQGVEDLPEDVAHPDVDPRECPTPMDAIEIIDEMAEHPEQWVWSSENTDPSAKKVEEREQTAVSIINNDIQPFMEGGEYEHFTKQTDIDLNDSTFFYVDMQQQEASTSIGLTMQVVYDLFYEMVKTIDIPSVIFMDEFHYMLRDAIAQKSLNQKFRHGRHWDLSLGVATQSFKDFFGEDEEGNAHLTDNAQVLFENMPTQIFHYEDMNEEWADEIGLTKDEAEFIQNAEPGNRELGYSTALLRVSDKGTYPLKVKMDFDENPREAVVTEYDPSEHGEDFYSYLAKHDGVCEWRFTPANDMDVIRQTEVKARGAQGGAEVAEQSHGPDVSTISATGDD